MHAVSTTLYALLRYTRAVAVYRRSRMRSVYRVKRSCPLCSTPAGSSTLPPATVAAGRPTGLLLLIFPSFLSVLRIRIRDPVPFWPLDPGSGMGKKSRLGSGKHMLDNIPESLETTFWRGSGSGFEIWESFWIWIRDQGWKKFWYGIRDKRSGSATLLFLSLLTILQALTCAWNCETWDGILEL